MLGLINKRVYLELFITTQIVLSVALSLGLIGVYLVYRKLAVSLLVFTFYLFALTILLFYSLTVAVQTNDLLSYDSERLLLIRQDILQSIKPLDLNVNDKETQQKILEKQHLVKLLSVWCERVNNGLDAISIFGNAVDAKFRANILSLLFTGIAAGAAQLKPVVEGMLYELQDLSD